MNNKLFFLFLFCSATLFSENFPLLLADVNSGNVYVIDPMTNEATAYVLNEEGAVPFANPGGVSASPDGSFFYVTDITNACVYRVEGSVETVQISNTFMPAMMDPFGVCISQTGNFAFVPDGNSNEIYVIDTNLNQVTGLVQNDTETAFDDLVTVSIDPQGSYAYATGAAVYRIDIGGSYGLGTVTSALTSSNYSFIQDPQSVWVNANTVYIADSLGSVYQIDPATNTASLATVVSGADFDSPASVIINAAGTTAYVFDEGNNSVYAIDVAANTATLLVTDSRLADEFPTNQLALSPDGTILYVPGGASESTEFAFAIDLSDPSTLNPITLPMGYPAFVYPSAFAAPFMGISGSTISLIGLTGNNLSLAQYLNAQAPAATRQLFSILTGSALESALQSASPARNAFSTFVSQTTVVALSRILADHTRRDTEFQGPVATAATVIDSDSLLAGEQPNRAGRPKRSQSVWFGAFGEYAREKGQSQTPEFKAGTGSLIGAWEIELQPHKIGTGVAWGYTHIHETGGAGHANVNQGELFFYGRFKASRWIFDTALWGGYYHVHNVRKIDFPGFSADASYKTHGWQFTPHLEIDYRYQSGSFILEPFTLIDWVSCWERGVNESGASPLNMGQKGRYSSLLRSETGLHFQEILDYAWGFVTFMEKLSYAYQKTFHTGTITAFLVGSPGAYTVSTLVGAQNLGVVEVEALFASKTPKRPYGSLSYHGEFGSRYQTHQGMVTIGLDF